MFQSNFGGLCSKAVHGMDLYSLSWPATDVSWKEPCIAGSIYRNFLMSLFPKVCAYRFFPSLHNMDNPHWQHQYSAPYQIYGFNTVHITSSLLSRLIPAVEIFGKPSSRLASCVIPLPPLLRLLT